jgi:cytochrome P450
VSRLASRVVLPLLRRRLGTTGLDLSRLGRLPAATLVALRRDGIDPVPELGQIRARATVSRLPFPFGLRVWLVTGSDEAKRVLADATGFSTDFANLAGGGGAPATNPGGLGFADPPAHTRLRRLLTPEFTMRRLTRLIPRVRDIVDARLDAMAQAPDPVDVVAAFALPIPSLVICELLGVPYSHRAQFQDLAMSRFDVATGGAGSLAAISDSLAYLRDVVASQRREPGDGLLGMIIRERGDEIGDEELAGLADGVLTGGFETTASMLSLGALVLLRDPVAAQRLRDDDAAVGLFVEEILRHLSVVQVAFPRFARRDLVIDGARIAEGDIVVVSLAAANRDPRLGAGLDSLDPTRDPVSHLAFGHGLHRCVGAELARLELRAAYPALVRRFPRLRLAVSSDQLRFRPASIVYGIESLPVHLGDSHATR